MHVSKLAFLACLAPVAASAADLPTRKQPVPPPVVAPAADSGFYTGAFVGGAFGGLSVNPGAGANASGFTTGTLAGYTWRFNPWSFGFEGDIASNSGTQKFASRFGAPATQIDNVYAIHARARLGYRLGLFEPFVAGGFALTDVAASRQAPAEFDGASARRAGWTLGAGVDANFALPWIGPTILRAEYLYDRFSPTTLTLNGPAYRVSGSEQYARLALIKYFNAYAPAPAEAAFAANWNGDYFGVLGGYTDARVATAAGSFNANGGSIGVFTGRNFMFGQGMLGFEGSTAFANVNGDGAQPLAASTHFHDYLLSDIRARAGWAFGRWMPYAAAGVAFDTSSQADRATGNYRGDVFQYSATVGAGLEYMISDRLSLRGEYLYARSLGSITTKLDSETCCAQTRDSSTFRLGLGYFLR